MLQAVAWVLYVGIVLTLFLRPVKVASTPPPQPGRLPTRTRRLTVRYPSTHAPLQEPRMSRPSPAPRRRPQPRACLALGVAACSGGGRPGRPPPRRPEPAPVARSPSTATDTSATVSATTAEAGTITFQVKNTGSKVNEFYVYGAGDRIVGEVENITPGLNRELKVEITEPGTFTTACKPGMVGDGIRAAFTVTGTAQPGSADQKVAKAIADYKAYVAAQSAELARRHRGVRRRRQGRRRGQGQVDLHRRRGSRGSGSSRSPSRSATSTRRSTAARTSSRRGCRSPGTTASRRTSGSTASRPTARRIADQLLADVKTIVEKAKAVDFTALSIANGAKELLDEVATDQDHRRGGAVLAYRPRRHEGEPPGLAGRARGAAPGHHRASARPGGGARPDASPPSTRRSTGTRRALEYATLTEVSADDVKALTVALDALVRRGGQGPGRRRGGSRRDTDVVTEPTAPVGPEATTQSASGVSRRRLLGVSAGAAVAGVAVGFGGGYATRAAAAPAADRPPTTTPASLDAADRRSAASTRPGSSRPAQDRMHFVALDVVTKDRALLVDLLKEWTRAAERMSVGAEAAPGGVVGGGPYRAPEDTGEAYGLPASG